MRYQRRFALATVLLLALVPALAMTATAKQDAGTPEDQLEIFSWWTSGGEAAALQALFDAFAAKYPNVEITNATVAGGGGANAQAVLQTRLSGGDPPDAWQSHPGGELFGNYVDAGYVAPVTDIYEEEGFLDVMPQGLIDTMTRDGEIYSVLAGVHRGNGFWYNKKLLDENGITIGETLSVEQFFEAADTLEAAGVPALCLGDKDDFVDAQTFENTLIGVVGPEKYLQLVRGEASFDDPQVREAMETFGRMLDYANDDHSARDWSQGVELLQEGGCAFNSMGDWAYGEFVAAGLEDNVDFGWVSHPGTDGAFVIVADGFPISTDAPHPVNARNWLRVIGSKEAQEAFNPLKGSIPARTDVDRSKFGPYHNWSMDSFGADTLVPSTAHGDAAPPGFKTALREAAIQFAADRDVDTFVDAMVSAQETELSQ